MKTITIVIGCRKNRCGKCDFCRLADNPAAGIRILSCDIFREFLQMDGKGRPKRCKRCLESA
jgi:hypothetical protein